MADQRGTTFSAPENLLHPRDYKAPEMPSSAQTHGKGEGSVMDLSEEQRFPAYLQSEGANKPGKWGTPSFPTPRAAKEGTDVKSESTVDLDSGVWSCDEYKK